MRATLLMNSTRQAYQAPARPGRRATAPITASARAPTLRGALHPQLPSQAVLCPRPRARAAAAPGSRSRNRTHAVSVQANLFARVARIVRSFFENTVSSAEDPERLLDTVMNDMQNDLIRMRQAAAQVLASQKMVEGKYKQAQVTADEWLRRAELAVSKGEDELAKEALRRRKAMQDQADTLKKQVTAQQQAVVQLLGNTRMLESKITEARGKKETLKARAASAKTSRQIQEMISGLNTSNAVVAFDKMEEKVLALEAEAEGTALLMAGDNALESQFAALEMGTVDDELAALKKGMLRAPATPYPVPSALPEGRPLRDAIDMELEQLRRRVRE